MVDREFNRLANEIEMYSNQILEDTAQGQLDYEIDGTSLYAYLESKFAKQIEFCILDPTLSNGEKTVIKELNIMGISSLKDLDDLINNIANDDLFRLVNGSTTFMGLLRDIMIIKDVDKYFSEAWANNWNGFSLEDVNFFSEFNIDFYKLAISYSLEFINEEDLYDVD